MNLQRLLTIVIAIPLIATGCTSLPPLGPAPPDLLLAGTEGPFVDPDSAVAQWVRANHTHPLRAEIEQHIASQPMARWPTTDPGRVRTEVDNLVTAASHVNRVPMIVLDGLPGPRCAPERPGGLPDADTYRTWVTNLVAGISQRPAIVIVEPNSLRTLDCLAPSDQQARLALIRDAVSILIAKAYRGAVLLDGGDGRGVPPRVMAGRLHDADVGRVEGFAIGGGYTADGDARTYGAAVRDELVRLGDRRDYFYEAIDSSRNGNGSRDQPCNPAGAKLGAPTRLNGSATDGQTLWITNPGISDGDCGIAKGTTPGQFSPELAHRLIVGT